MQVNRFHTPRVVNGHGVLVVRYDGDGLQMWSRVLRSRADGGVVFDGRLTVSPRGGVVVGVTYEQAITPERSGVTVPNASSRSDLAVFSYDITGWLRGHLADGGAGPE